jgi:hypothetical protein
MEKLPYTRQWTSFEKIAFRFSFVFLALFVFLYSTTTFPFFFFGFFFSESLHQFISWLGPAILGTKEITVFTNGSGDTTYDYLVVFFCCATAAVSCVIWTLADRRSHYETLYYYLTVAVRFYVAFTLIEYGLIKVIKIQFPDPDLYKMTQTFGKTTPMGLAWTFLGYSKGYNYFMGFVEIAAILLLFRRTVTFGALLTMMTAANIMAINYFYDVPVKILSTALFFMSLFLLARDAKKLFQFFFSDRAVSLSTLQPPNKVPRWFRITSISLKWVGIAVCFSLLSIQVATMFDLRAQNHSKNSWYGVYKVETFVMGKDTLHASSPEYDRWHNMIVDGSGAALIELRNDSVRKFDFSADTVAKTVTISPAMYGRGRVYNFHYQTPDTDRLAFVGEAGGDSVKITFKVLASGRQAVMDHYPLLAQEFHWISESPNNP